MRPRLPGRHLSLSVRIRGRLLAWFDSEALAKARSDPGDSGLYEASIDDDDRIDFWRVVPFIGLHLACLGAFWTGWSVTGISVAIALYAIRMLAITGFYHRYFAHRAFTTGRIRQFLFAVLGASAAQRGPLWWASHHRHHHAHADAPDDAHSPHQRGFFWSHMGWFLTRGNFATRTELIADLARYPELRWLDRFDVAVPLALTAALYVLGEWLAQAHPSLGTNGVQLLVWGFAISTVVLYHATFCVNSLAHHLGRRRYATRDQSRNNAWLALFTFGEGWHNNHHHFPGSARQGFHWWELDLTYYVLKAMAISGLISKLRTVPARALAARRVENPS